MMTRTESDLREALRELERRADRLGTPPGVALLERAPAERHDRSRSAASRHLQLWLPPLAAAAVVLAAALGAVAIGQSSHSSHRIAPQGGVRGSGTVPSSSASTSPRASATTGAASPSSPTAILADAAAKLDAATGWTAPQPHEFFYVHTTQATTWSSVSGQQAGKGLTADGANISVAGCESGHIVAAGESGTCTLNDVPHYLADAPSTPAAWDAYLEQIAPGAKAAGAQGKIIMEVLHQDLVAPHAAAALLRYTADCPGLHTMSVRPVNGETLIGVTCTSMTAGSYGLVFDAHTGALVGFVTVNPKGVQADAAELVLRTGIVTAIGLTP